MYNLIIKKSARKELDNIPNLLFLKIDEAVLALKDNPYPNTLILYHRLKHIMKFCLIMRDIMAKSKPFR